MKLLDRIALRSPLKPLALACAAALGLGGIALATPIITDTFTRADGALNGSSPEFGTGTWSTTNAWNVTSGEAASPAGEGSAYIPIGHVTPGNTYTFTVQARNGGSWYWAGLGFSNTNTSTYFGNTGQYGLRTNSGELQIFESGAYKGSPAGGNFTVNNQFKLVLDTTSGYAWTIGCFLNGSETPIYTMTLAPSLDINYVMVSSNNDGGGTSIFDNVQVTVAEGTPLAFTTTTVVSSDYITAVGDPVTFTATIVPASGSAFPAGNVQFKLDGVNKGSAVPVTQVGSTSNGTAAIAGITDIPAGQAHVVTAEYLPDPGFVISTGTLSPNQTVLSPAQSIVVYDTFTRADSVLNGSSPETGPGPWNVHTTQTELWNVVSGAVTSGWLSAFVPIGTVTSGKIYTASADMTNVTSSWMMLGFSDVNTAVDVEAGIVWRTNGGGGQLFSNNVYQGGHRWCLSRQAQLFDGSRHYEPCRME